MSEDQPPLTSALAALRQHVRRLVWWSGLSLSVAALLGSLILAGGLDRCFDDNGLRWLLSAGVWTAVVWTIWRTLIAPLRLPLSDVLLAEQIEQRFPGLEGRLSAAMEFCSSGYRDVLGSPELQHLVVGQASDDLTAVDPQDVLEPRKVRPAIVTGMAACLVASLVLWCAPLNAATALRRLAVPWGDFPWPRSTVLQIVKDDGTPLTADLHDPVRVVRGAMVELLVENLRGPIPNEVWLETRLPEQSTPTRELLLRTTRIDKHGTTRTVAAIQLPATRETIDFRAVGGDDDQMLWHRLSTVESPTLAEFTMTLAPPGYLTMPAETLPKGATHAAGLLGSEVTIAAVASKPLQSVRLARRDGSSDVLKLQPDGLHFQATVPLEQPGVTTVWFQLQDRQGFLERDPLQFELRGLVDALPDVVLRDPASDLVVTPDAEVPLAIDARDDFGLVSARLAWQREASPAAEQPLAAWEERPKEATATTTWPLKELLLQPGERVIFRVGALDACDVNGPHIGQSAPRTLIVVSSEEKRQDLAARIGELVDDLQEAREQQERIRQQTADVERQLNDVGALRPEDLDALNRLELNQRQLTGRLTDSIRGTIGRTKQLRREFPINQLQDPSTEAQLEQLAQSLEQLEPAALVPIARDLTQAGKLAESLKSADGPTLAEKAAASAGAHSPPEKSQAASVQEAATALEHAGRLQDDVVQSLGDWQQQLAEWRSERSQSRQLDALLKEQADINAATAEMAADAVGKSTAELSPQQRSDLQKLFARQRQEAQRIDQFEQQLRKHADAIADDAPTAAAQALDAADQLHDSQLSAKLRQAAEDVAANRFGSAGAAQKAGQETLQKLRDEWDARVPDDSEQLVKHLHDAEQQAAQLSDDEETLRKHVEDAAQEAISPSKRDELRHDATTLRRQAQRLERQLQRLRMKRSAETAQRAAARLRQAERDLDENGAADEVAESLAAAHEDLEQLQDELAAARRRTQEQLAQEEIEKLAMQLTALKTRQESVLAETTRLEEQRQQRGQWTRAQLRSLKDLADVEKGICEELTTLQQKVAEAFVIHAALDYAARDLRRSAARLDARLTDSVTQQWELNVVRRLEHVIQVWNEQSPSDDGASPSPDQPNSNDDDAQQASPPGEGLPPRLQLQLLRALQADCLERTKTWDRRQFEQGRLTEDEVAAVKELAVEQGELASLAERLVEQFKKLSAPSAQSPQEAPQ